MISRWRQWFTQLWERMRSTDEDEPADLRSSAARERFWEEFRAGRQVADERKVASTTRPEPVTR